MRALRRVRSARSWALAIARAVDDRPGAKLIDLEADELALRKLEELVARAVAGAREDEASSALRALDLVQDDPKLIRISLGLRLTAARAK